MTDKYGREILSTNFSGGVRYYSTDGSISTALERKDDNVALTIFNENPPKTIQVGENQEASKILDLLENLNTKQLSRLKAILNIK